MDAETDLYYRLYNLLDAFWRRRYIFFVSVVCIPILACITTLIMPKHYEAITSIATYNTAPPFMKDISYLPDIVEQFSSLSAYVTSPAVLKKISLKVGLINAQTSQENTQKIISQLGKDITMTLVEKSTVEIKLIKDNPKDMVNILNLLSKEFIDQFMTPLTTSVKASVIYLKNEVSIQKKKLDESADKFARFAETNNDFLPSYGAIYIIRLRQVITALGDKEAEYKATLAQEKMLKKSLLKTNTILGNLDNAIADNDAQLNKMRLIYTDNYSGVKAAIEIGKSLKEQRAQFYKKYEHLNEENLQQLWNMVLSTSLSKNEMHTQPLLAKQLDEFQNLELKLKGLGEELSNLKIQENDLNQKLNKVGQVEKQLAPLKQSVTENLELYQNLLKRYNMTNLTANLNISDKYINVKIVSYPQKPYKYLGRPFFFYFFMGIIGGIFLGLGLITFFEMIDNTARTKQSIEALTGVLVICRVGKMSMK
jgi:capsular polysaccharide biosynthesis protein